MADPTHLCITWMAIHLNSLCLTLHLPWNVWPHVTSPKEDWWPGDGDAEPMANIFKVGCLKKKPDSTLQNHLSVNQQQYNTLFQLISLWLWIHRVQWIGDYSPFTYVQIFWLYIPSLFLKRYSHLWHLCHIHFCHIPPVLDLAAATVLGKVAGSQRSLLWDFWVQPTKCAWLYSKLTLKLTERAVRA